MHWFMDCFPACWNFPFLSGWKSYFIPPSSPALTTPLHIQTFLQKKMLPPTVKHIARLYRQPAASNFVHCNWLHKPICCMNLYCLSSYSDSTVIKSRTTAHVNSDSWPSQAKINLKQLDQIWTNSRSTWQWPQVLPSLPCSTSSPPPPAQP